MARTTKKTDEPVDAQPVMRLSKIERLQQELRAAEAKQQARGLKKLDDLMKSRGQLEIRAVQLQNKLVDLEAEIARVKAELPIITDGVGQLPPVDSPEVEEHATAPGLSDTASDQED